MTIAPTNNNSSLHELPHLLWQNKNIYTSLIWKSIVPHAEIISEKGVDYCVLIRLLCLTCSQIWDFLPRNTYSLRKVYILSTFELELNPWPCWSLTLHQWEREPVTMVLLWMLCIIHGKTSTDYFTLKLVLELLFLLVLSITVSSVMVWHTLSYSLICTHNPPVIKLSMHQYVKLNAIISAVWNGAGALTEKKKKTFIDSNFIGHFRLYLHWVWSLGELLLN